MSYLEGYNEGLRLGVKKSLVELPFKILDDLESAQIEIARSRYKPRREVEVTTQEEIDEWLEGFVPSPEAQAAYDNAAIKVAAMYAEMNKKAAEQKAKEESKLFMLCLLFIVVCTAIGVILLEH
jgi:ribosomal protein L12E/L44/L45/RPP1/RPP2